MSAPLYIVDAFLRLVSLGPYWGAKLDADEPIGHQVSGRGGEVVVPVDGERVRLSGRAMTGLSGELL